MALYHLNDVFGYQDANEAKTLWASNEAPSEETTDVGEIWLDTSAKPYKLKRRSDLGEWETIAGGITVDSTTGFVGIGTTEPDLPLTIEVTGENSNLKCVRTDGATAILAGGETYAWVGSLSEHQTRIGTGGNVKMTVNTDGRVGIGTTSPGSKLHVIGDAHITGTVFIDNQLLLPTSEPSNLVDGSIWIV